MYDDGRQELRVEGPDVPIPLSPRIPLGEIAVRTRVAQIITPGRTATLTLEYDRFVEGAECTLEITIGDEFNKDFGALGLICTQQQLHSSRNAFAFVRCGTNSPVAITIPKGTLVGYAIL